jgi:hypothetical protein
VFKDASAVIGSWVYVCIYLDLGFRIYTRLFFSIFALCKWVLRDTTVKNILICSKIELKNESLRENDNFKWVLNLNRVTWLQMPCFQENECQHMTRWESKPSLFVHKQSWWNEYAEQDSNRKLLNQIPQFVSTIIWAGNSIILICHRRYNWSLNFIFSIFVLCT